MTNLFSDLYIFEIANNHQGSVEHGRRIVREMARIARECRIKAAVKFQYRDLDSFIHPEHRESKENRHIARFLSTRLSMDEFRSLLEECREQELQTIVTPFDERSVDRCLEHGVDILKIASCSSADWPLLEEVAKTGRPVIASTGGINLQAIDKLVSFFSHRHVPVGIMHCVGIYPTPPEALNLNFVTRLRKRFPDVPIGYSGHESPENLDVVKVAIACGAQMFERHVGVPTDTIQLNKYSMAPAETEAWVRASLQSKLMLGSDDSKRITQQEIDSLRSLMRGAFTSRPIKSGEVIGREDVFFAMPCEEGQLTSGEFGRHRSRYVASRDYAPNSAIFEAAHVDQINLIRSFVHDVKGMLYESQIVIGESATVELSHHHGIDQFRRLGSVIVNVVNRDYCKKLIIVFPGQQHPTHFHKKKEETFQLLWGDLNVTKGNAEYVMTPGDTMLIEIEEPHSFRSRGGAIFEEISTRHYRDDSYYVDERISKMDPMERKTILENW